MSTATELGQLELSEANVPCVVLMDADMGRDRAMDAIRICRTLHWVRYLIIVELANDIEVIADYIEAGVNGYALKGATSEDVAYTIEQVKRGLSPCAPDVAANIFKRLARISEKSLLDPLKLTRREMEILNRIVKGYSNKEIAQEFVIEIRTVKHHVHNILSKLNVRHRWDAARYAVQQGWFKEAM